MNPLESNVFSIANLHELAATYRLYEIIGLAETGDEFDSNIQFIIKKLSFGLNHPVTVIPDPEAPDKKAYLVIKDDPLIATRIPVEFEVKQRDFVYFRPTDRVLALDFRQYDDFTREICRRFLQFEINNPIKAHRGLWQPGAGQPFFSKTSRDGDDKVAVYNGFLPRVVELPGGGWGISVEITKCYVERYPLSAYLTRDEFERFKGNHFVYHYGHEWYEVKAQAWNELNAAEYKYRRESDGARVTVLEELRSRISGPMPPEIAQLPDDVSLLVYANNRDEMRRIPAALCYRVLDTEDPLVKRLHRLSIIPPFERRKNAHIVRRNYLSNLTFGNVRLQVSNEALQIERRVFDYPDQILGNDTMLSPTGTPGTTYAPLSELGRIRKKLLLDPDVGCYTQRPFERQLLMLPESAFRSFGQRFIQDLKDVINRMHPTREGWNPEVITYDDRNNRRADDLGIEIVAQLRKKVAPNIGGGYALIMIPRRSLQKRTQDDLATLCVVQGDKLGLETAVMHDDTLKRCFGYDEKKGYFVKERGLYTGYVQGVAINKVLLNNERWPFILSRPLHADLVVGIDVKNALAGYTFVTKLGDSCKPIRKKAKRREQLDTVQVRAVLTKNITDLSEYETIRHIVIHRDGRLFRSELNGICQAFEELKKNGTIPEDATITVVEIPKNSAVTLRLFEVTSALDTPATRYDNGAVLNPQLGTWVEINPMEGFVCTTGREFPRPGTSIPLYVKRPYGTMPLSQVLEDVFALSTLAYTKPDDCSRNPWTIKATDRRINDYGGYYDEDAFEELKELKLD